jgi:hypothetical protein
MGNVGGPGGKPLGRLPTPRSSSTRKTRIADRGKIAVEIATAMVTVEQVQVFQLPMSTKGRTVRTRQPGGDFKHVYVEVAIQ